MRKIMLATVLAGMLVMPVGAQANHAGCVANAVTGLHCTFTAAGASTATGYVGRSLLGSGGSIWVMRADPVTGEPTRVDLWVSSGTTGQVVQEPIASQAGELVHVDISAGVLEVGMASGH